MFFSLYCLFIFMTIVRFFIIASKKIRYLSLENDKIKKRNIDHLMKSSELTHLDLEYYYYWNSY